MVSSTYPPNTNLTACSGGSLYNTKVTSGGSYRLRLINHSSFFSFWFSVDNHTLEIVEIDGHEIEPIVATGVNVNIGQRYSVILHANQTAGNYAMRASLPQTCFIPFNTYSSTGLVSTNYQVSGIISYDSTSPSIPTIGTAGNTTNPSGASRNPFNNLIYEGCNDMPFDAAVPKRVEAALNASVANTHYIVWSFNQAQNVDRIFVNKTAWAPMERNASFFKALDTDWSNSSTVSASNTFGLNQQLLTLDSSGAAQLVINSIDTMEHPWHMHGHSFQVVGWGWDVYGAGNTTWNLENPLRRDTITIPAKSHVILRWETDNPGLWALHCHVAWHMESGMLVQFAERPDDLKALVKGMNQGTYQKALSFCGVDDDQAFGTSIEDDYHPPHLAHGT